MNLMELAIKIGVDDQASSAVGKISQKLGNGLKAAAKVGIAAVSAASAAVVALAKESVEAYAEYEQLVGGVDTLFKSSSQKLQTYAANAYKTAGISANEYMSLATSFSASLLQSLENDTEAAAEYADLAITDMADNANKMGTSIEMIQNAYQGFAKQNYTMLDNLKLGYGGTKTEMERLIKDAAALSSTVDAQSLSFANVVEAIHVVQTEMGITGTTSKEAAETISGSTASMKAAFENLKVGISDETADIDLLIDNFVESAYTAGTNILDRAIITVEGIKGIFSNPEQRNKFIQLGKDLLGQIADGMKVILGIEDDENPITWAGKTAQDIIVKLTTWFADNSGDIINSAKELLGAFFDGLLGDDDSGRSGEFIAGQVVGNIIRGITNALASINKDPKLRDNVKNLAMAQLSGDQDATAKYSELLAKQNSSPNDFWSGLVYGIDPYAGYVSVGYDASKDIVDTTPELTESATLVPTPGATKYPTLGNAIININYANPNISAEEIGSALQTGLEEWEESNE